MPGTEVFIGGDGSGIESSADVLNRINDFLFDSPFSFNFSLVPGGDGFTFTLSQTFADGITTGFDLSGFVFPDGHAFLDLNIPDVPPPPPVHVATFESSFFGVPSFGLGYSGFGFGSGSGGTGLSYLAPGTGGHVPNRDGSDDVQLA